MIRRQELTPAISGAEHQFVRMHASEAIGAACPVGTVLVNDLYAEVTVEGNGQLEAIHAVMRPTRW